MGVSPTSTSTATIPVFSTLLRSQGGGAHETLGVPPCERQNHDKVEEETIVAVGIEVGDTHLKLNSDNNYFLQLCRGSGARRVGRLTFPGSVQVHSCRARFLPGTSNAP